MANRQERRRTMKTQELREQAIEAMGQIPYLDLECDNDVVVRVWHPLLVDDNAQTRLEKFNTGQDLDKDRKGETVVPHKIDGVLADSHNIRSARAILGEDEHARFVAAGGQSNDVQLAWNELVRTHKDEDDVLGAEMAGDEEDPK